MTEIERLEVEIQTRITLCEEFNNHLRRHTGWWGLVSWWSMNSLIKKWLKDQQKLIDQRGALMGIR